MSPILSLLNQMRGRLGMYLGQSSLVRLAAFLRGYEQALEELAPNRSDHFLADMRDWIHHRYETTQWSWEEVVLRNSPNETEAVNQFWELLDEFTAERQLQEDGQAQHDRAVG